MKKRIPYIGTSGWVYKSWHKKLYPADMKKDFLAVYGRHFNSVEINTSFYHLPAHKTFAKWRSETPADFRFAVKISRYITHIERLSGGREPLRRFLSAASHLKEKLLVVLVQLPPLLAYDSRTFARFIADYAAANRRKPGVPFAFEPRHASWFEEANLSEIRRLMKKHGFALVFAHSAVYPSYDPDDPENLTSHLVYLRFHGPKEFAASKYGARRLAPWRKRIAAWQKKGATVCAYFNDDAHGFAVMDARALRGDRSRGSPTKP